MPLGEFTRDFDYPDRFEKEKVTRLMPSAVQEMGAYTLRMMMPPGSKPFAAEYLGCLIDKTEFETHFILGIMLSQSGHEKDFRITDTRFSKEGLMIMSNPGRKAFPEYPEQIEMGYLVGSLDPLDIEFGELTQKEVISHGSVFKIGQNLQEQYAHQLVES